MTLLSGAALAALVLVVPLVALHLRRRKPPRRAVGSLLAWRDLPTAGGGGARRIGRPPLPLLLVLQMLALILLVGALARPVSNESATTSAHVYVVDESMWMGADQGGTARIDAAREVLRERLAGLPSEEAVRIVGAGTTPTVLFEGKAAEAGSALGDLRAGPGAANLTAALRLAAGLRSGAGDRIALLRAPEEAAPEVRGGGSSYEDLEVGEPFEDASLSAASAHCDRLGAEACEVFVRVADAGGAARTLPVRVAISGEPVHTVPVELPRGEAAPLVFTAPPGAMVRMSLPPGGGLAANDTAFVSVPEPGGESITLVGNRSRALPLARALASVPGVKLRLRTPATYRPTDPGTSDLLVLDDFVPAGGLPDAPALLLVNPPRFPGGSGGSLGKMRDSRLSGTEAASPLLAGADISALTIGAGAARRLALPASISAAAWSSEGPLIAAGTDAGRRVAVMAFEPAESNLPQLAAFPALIDNIVAWSQRLAPQAAAAGMPFALAEPPGTSAATLRPAAGGAARQLRVAAGTEVPVAIAAPGNYVVTLKGPWGTRELALAVNPGPAAAPGAPVDLSVPAPAADAGHTDLWPWLLAAALLALILEALYAWRREPRRGGRASRRIAVGLQAASVALLVVALLDPTVGSKPPATTLVLDRSLSIGTASGEAESEWLAANRGCGKDCRVVQFGGGAEVTGDGLLPRGAGGSVEGRESNLAAALELALARTPRGGRVVLLSDGRQTAGEPTSLAAAARERGVTVDTVALTRQPADAALTRLGAPGALHAGDPLSLEVTVRSTGAAPAVLTVRRDGVAVGHQKVTLGAGDNPYLFSVRVPRHPGSYGYEVAVRSAGDSRPGNDALGTTVRVEAPPKALVAGADGSAAAEVLSADGFDVTAVAPGALPTSAAGYKGVDAVVLEDVSAAQLGKLRARAIDAAVRTQALGLLAFGGEHSFSLGKYYKSPLQDALPVKSLVPGKLQRKNVAVELVLDRSGSMINEVGGVPKIAMAQAAARGALDFLLKHRDEIGIVAFEVKAKPIVPLTRVEPANVRAIERKINNIPANGGTNVYKGLAAGVREIERSTAKERHIILLTDGISEPGSYARLLPGLKRGKISVATVALGAEADFKLLKQIAADTGGNYYRTENARELPKIFDKETRLNTRTVRLRGEIGVSAGDPSPITGSLVGEHLPPLRGNVVTELKPGAEAALLGQDKNHPPDPVLAQWQYGSGRAAAWTPGLTRAWAGEWLERERLFQDAGRWVERGVAPPPLTPSLAPGDQRTLEVAPTTARGRSIVLEALEGTLTSPAGKTIPLRFEESAPGRWTAPLPALPGGEYEYALASAGAGSLAGTLAIPYPAELRLGRIDTTPLGPVAAASGGTTLSAADPGAIEGSSHRIWWLFAALALACFLVGAGLRLLARGWGGEDDEPPSRQDLSDRDASARSNDADSADLQPDPA